MSWVDPTTDHLATHHDDETIDGLLRIYLHNQHRPDLGPSPGMEMMAIRVVVVAAAGVAVPVGFGTD